MSESTTVATVESPVVAPVVVEKPKRVRKPKVVAPVVIETQAQGERTEARDICDALGYNPDKVARKYDHSQQRHTMPGTFGWKGHSGCAILRYFGHMGLNVAQCQAGAKKIGLGDMSKACVQSQRYTGSKGLKLPVLTEKEIETLSKVIANVSKK